MPKARALRIIKAWQEWAPATSQPITALLKIGKSAGESIALRCIGQSIGPKTDLRRELGALTAIEPTNAPIEIKMLDFFAAVKSFAGCWDYETGYFKEKSDYAASLSDDGVETLLDRLPLLPGRIAILNAYGGAINSIANTASAFPHRAGVGVCIHYYSQWSKKSDTAARSREMATLYAAMRPHVSGGAYVNYCDSDLQDWERAYWAANLTRLKGIKLKYDPGDLFRHGQSIRLP